MTVRTRWIGQIQSELVSATFTVASSAVVSGDSLDPVGYSVAPRRSALPRTPEHAAPKPCNVKTHTWDCLLTRIPERDLA
jgi:hypothetical protein